MLYIMSIFLPLISFLIVGLLRNLVDKRVLGGLAVTLMLIAAVISWNIFFEVIKGGGPVHIDLFPWIRVGDLNVNWSIYFDSLSSTMLMVVNTVSCLVHIYSLEYMEKDEAQNRFMAYLGLFTFAMLMLISADNLLQLFFGWEGVGLASYLLIGFWYHKESANAAAIKAFVVNRVGDLFLVAGIALLFFYVGDIHYKSIFKSLASLEGREFFNTGFQIIEVAGVFLFLGAMGKSAQLGLHTWLPDAMEGPTPVSALIHAATMVTAGVFLVCRMSPLYEMAPFAKNLILVIGASTAFFAGTIAIVQNDIKRVIAYSTCSQLGYMFASAGAGAYNGAMFHLTTHAFFKALLFLGVGAVIHAMSDEQDMRKMGGLRSYIPKTYLLMLIGSLALIGIPPFAGYFSKDAILESIWAGHTIVNNYGFWMGIIAAVLTAFYSIRLLVLTFHGDFRSDEVTLGHVHEPGFKMMAPVFVLSLGAIFSGYVGFDYFIMNKDNYWAGAIVTEHLEHAAHPPLWVVYSPLVAGVIGMYTAWVMYVNKPFIPVLISDKFSKVYDFLLNKWYFDELYDYLFVNPAKAMGAFLWQDGDKGIIDRFGPDGVAVATVASSNEVAKLNTGYVFNYAFYFMVGLLFLVSFVIFISW